MTWAYPIKKHGTDHPGLSISKPSIGRASKLTRRQARRQTFEKSYLNYTLDMPATLDREHWEKVLFRNPFLSVLKAV